MLIGVVLLAASVMAKSYTVNLGTPATDVKSLLHFIKVLDGFSRVATYTAFGTPQHGYLPGCVTVPDQCPGNQVLQALNRGDDTPGSIYYTSIASTDEPAESDGSVTRLDGGACLPLADGGPHFAEPSNRTIYRAVRDGLTASCPPGQLELVVTPRTTPQLWRVMDRVIEPLLFS